MEKQLNSPEKLTKISRKIARVERNEKGQLQKGSILNPEGLKEGTKHFSTLMDETVDKIAEANNITVREAWQVLIRMAYSEARNKNFPFYKDIFDRYFGKAVERHELTGKDGKDLFQPTEEEKAKVNKALGLIK